MKEVTDKVPALFGRYIDRLPNVDNLYVLDCAAFTWLDHIQRQLSF